MKHVVRHPYSIAFVLTAMIPIPTVRADVPRLISYQGKLRDAGGAAVTTTVSVRFRLYDGATSDTPVLFEETLPTVAVTNGLFSVLLGSETPGGVPDAAIDAGEVWLGVAIDDGDELSPRSRIASGPHAIKALAAERLVQPNTFTSAVTVDGSGNVGVGTTNPGANLEVAGQVKVTGGSPGEGKVLTSDGDGLASWETPPLGLPSGTSGQTLRHDGAAWVADGNLYSTGAAVGIGTTDVQSYGLRAFGDVFLGGELSISASPTFGVGGVVQSHPSSTDDGPSAIAVDAAYVYVGGNDNVPGHREIRIEKRDKNTGALISGFGTGGVVQHDLASVAVCTAIAIDAASIYVAEQDNGAGWQGGVQKRDINTGALDSGFGSGGMVTINPTGGDDGPQGLALDGASIYIAAYDQGASYDWRLEKRDKTTGALDSAFGSGGVIRESPSGASDSTQDIAVDAAAIYVSGLDRAPGNYQCRVEKRDKTTGALISGFGSGGVVVNNVSSGEDYLWAINIDAAAIYLAGSSNVSGGDYQWRIEKRDINTGALVSAFGSGGVVQNNPTGADDTIQSIASDASYLYLGGFDRVPGSSYQWRVEKRDKTTGALVSAFSTGGVVQSDPSSADDYISGIAVDAAGLYLAGNDQVPGVYQWRIEKRDITTGALISGLISTINGMHVSSGGNVGIGTTSPAYQLQLSTDSAAKPSSNTWTIASDRRVKKDIEPFTDGLETIERINPIKYRLNGKAGLPEGTEGISVVAQDAKAVIPYAISTYKAKLEPSDVEETDIYNFDSSPLTFVLINAVKEQQVEIKKQRADLEAVRAELKELKEKKTQP